MTTTLTPADFYDDEADFRDEIAALAKRRRWQVQTEVSLKVGRVSWGRIDLMARPKVGKPLLIECKLRIRSLGELRRAVEQAHAYRTLLGIDVQTIVAAPEITCERPAILIREAFGVHVATGRELSEAINHRDIDDETGELIILVLDEHAKDGNSDGRHATAAGQYIR